MNDSATDTVPVWFWVIAVIAVLWNAMGVFAYYSDVTMTPEALAALPEAQQELRAATPSWVTGAYAVAVFMGLLGALTLLIRKSWAVALFAISLAAVIIQMGYVIVVLKAPSVLGGTAVVFPLVVILLGALLLWFSINARSRSWLA